MSEGKEMTITFVVEDGTGLSDATSYCTVDEFKQYWFNKNYDYNNLTEDQIKRLLNDVTAYIDNSYRNGFPGKRDTTTQSLEWGREDAYYLDGFTIDDGTVPPEIKSAVNEMSYLVTQGNDPEAIISKSGKILKEASQVDVIKESFTYEEGSPMSQDIYTSVDNILSRITGGVKDAYVIKVIRVGGESA